MKIRIKETGEIVKATYDYLSGHASVYRGFGDIYYSKEEYTIIGPHATVSDSPRLVFIKVEDGGDSGKYEIGDTLEGYKFCKINHIWSSEKDKWWYFRSEVVVKGSK